jgi:hypothetical protein
MSRNNMLVWKFWEIKTKDEAYSVIKQTAYMFYFVAGLMVLLAFLLDMLNLIDAFVFAILATFLLILKSRVVAIILALLSGAMLVTTFLTKLGVMGTGGENIFLAMIVAYIAVAGVYAAFKFQKLK